MVHSCVVITARPRPFSNNQHAKNSTDQISEVPQRETLRSRIVQARTEALYVVAALEQPDDSEDDELDREHEATGSDDGHAKVHGPGASPPVIGVLHLFPEVSENVRVRQSLVRADLNHRRASIAH